MDKTKLIAFYLPQFHPIPENNEWWGKGFTEWTNTSKAAPLFDGHYQPHLPADLGFYDLRVRETVLEQIQLAQKYGIDAFCYHYYWFSGKQLLERPLNDLLNYPQRDLPFCLCWANESWNRRWDGSESHALIEQKYLPEDDLQFIRDIGKFLKDPRYMRIDGKPFLIVYKPQDIPDTAKTTRVWRDYCISIGIDDIHLCHALTFGCKEKFDGFDSVVDFPPHNAAPLEHNASLDFYAPFNGRAYEFTEMANWYLHQPRAAAQHFRTVFPSWDNTARTGSRARLVINSSPENYEYWLTESVRKTSQELPEDRQLVFINAWNEWAEGCHLEPDRRYGHEFLQATLRAKHNESIVKDFVYPAITSKARSFFKDLYAVFSYHALLILARAGTWRRRQRAMRKASGKQAGS